MKLLILGSNGLLGNTLTKYFFLNSKYETFAFFRDYSKLNNIIKIDPKRFINIKNVLDTAELKMKIKEIKPDVVINCIGITNKLLKKDKNLEEKYMEINSIFPHKLREICSDFEARLIHFSSDCVFSGKKGFYSENDKPDPIDLYGKSKLLGELNFENTITIRKSVIGHEIVSKNGLLEWFLDQEGRIEGYKKAIFSGLTVLELAKIIEIYVIPNKKLKGIFHVSGQAISKYDLLKIISYEYKKLIDIVPNHLVKIDRSLDGNLFNNLTGYQTKPWPLLIKAMSEFNFL